MNMEVSFEFFPPKNDAGLEGLCGAAQALAALNPHFMTCTYGAGGSTRDGTLATLTALRNILPDMPFACHLTCASTPKSDLADYTDRLYDLGIRHIVALRGDLPEGWVWPKNDPDYFDYSSDFVAWLKDRHDFEISVGTYPEKHPDAETLQTDIDALRLKQGAGADRAITQFFYDDDAFLTFRDEIRRQGITIELVPGLLPITDFAKMVSFAGRCGAIVPQTLHERFAPLASDPEAQAALGADILAAQIDRLRQEGCNAFHIYTLNKAEPSIATLSPFLDAAV